MIVKVDGFEFNTDLVEIEFEDGRKLSIDPDYQVQSVIDHDTAVVTLPNNSTMEFDREDGTIRYVDLDGNTENLWRVGDDDYDKYKNDYFPDLNIVEEVDAEWIDVDGIYDNDFEVDASELLDKANKGWHEDFEDEAGATQ